MSKKISPRNPLNKDEDLLDYDVESDEDWEEEEPGESLSNSETEDEDDPDNLDNAIEDDEGDGFFVPHGYLSDDEGVDGEEELSHEAKKARQIAKACNWETQMKRKAQTAKPVVIGCLWLTNVDQSPSALLDKLLQYKVECLEPKPFHTTFSAQKTDDATNAKTKRTQKTKGLKRGVAKEAMPDLIRLVHGNPHSFVKLIREFREFWRLKMGGQPPKEKSGETSESAAESGNVPNDLNVSATSVDELPCTPTSSVDKDSASPKEEHQIFKRQLKMEISNMAVYEKREGLKRSHCFNNKDVLEKHNMTDLPIPCTCEWDYIVIKPTVKNEKCTKHI